MCKLIKPIASNCVVILLCFIYSTLAFADACYSEDFQSRLKSASEAKPQDSEKIRELNMEARECYQKSPIWIKGDFDPSDLVVGKCLQQCMNLWVSSDAITGDPLKQPSHYRERCVNEMKWEATVARGTLGGFGCGFLKKAND